MLLSNLLETTRYISEEFHDSVASGNYSIPSGSELLWVDISAGGAGGGPGISINTATTSTGENKSAAGQGGQAGAACSILIALDNTRLDSDISWTIGDGGIGGLPVILTSPSSDSSGTWGDSGGNTSFGDFITCKGGSPGTPAFYDHSALNSYGGGQIENGLTKADENNYNDSDIFRHLGVEFTPVFQGHLVISIRNDLGFTAGGRGEKGSLSASTPNEYNANNGNYYGIMQSNNAAYDGSSYASGGGGGGNTCFGAGGAGGEAGASNDSCNGDSATLGYGAGGGGGAAFYERTGNIGYAGKGGPGKQGFIRIRAFGA